MNGAPWRIRLGGAARTVTPLGWFVVAATLVGCACGLLLGWVEGWFVGVVGAVLFAIGLPFLIGSRAYAISLVRDPGEVVVGGAVRATLRVANRGGAVSLPAVAEVPFGEALREVAVPAVPAGGSVELALEAPALRRGVVVLGPVTVARRDPVGLVRREVTWRERHRVHVHPVTTPLPPNSAGLVRDLEGAASRKLTDADLSFHAVREYAPGDPLRHVHWKSTAKTGMLMVRQFEESQTARVAVLFDAAPVEYTSEAEFELGVSAAASLALQAVREGRERFIASGWRPGRVPARVDGLEELPSRSPAGLLDAWSELRPAPAAAPVETLARSLALSGRDLSLVIAVTGSLPDMTRLRRTAAAFRPDVQVAAVRCELHAEPGVQFVDRLRVLTVGALADLPQLLARSAA